MFPNYADYKTLLERLKMHDVQAFKYLYSHSRHRLFALALTLLKEEAAAQDLIQDFFIDFWEKQKYNQIEHALLPYIVQAVRNQCLHYLDKQLTRQRKLRFFEQGDQSVSIIHHLENTELRLQLEAALSKVPTVAAKVFRMHYIDHISHADIANQLNISKSTVSNHIARALRILRAELKK